MSKGENIVTFPSGAASSSAPRYDLVPRALLEAVATRFEAGARKYGENQWRKGLRDPQFLRERANHALQHLLNYIHGTDNGEDTAVDNLGAVGWAVAVLLEAEAAKRSDPTEPSEPQQAAKVMPELYCNPIPPAVEQGEGIDIAARLRAGGYA